MAIAKKPQSSTVDAFIADAGKHSDDIPGDEGSARKLPIMIRIDPAMLKRIDAAAKRRGLSRSAWLVYSATRELDREEA